MKHRFAFLPVLLHVLLMSLFAVQMARAADKAAPAKIDPVPEGWTVNDFGGGMISASFSALSCHCNVACAAKDSGAKLSFADYAKFAKLGDHASAQKKDRKESDLKPAKFGGHEALEYEYIDETYDGTKFHYRTIYLSVGENYVTLSFWCPLESWDAAQKQFDALANNVK